MRFVSRMTRAGITYNDWPDISLWKLKKINCGSEDATISSDTAYDNIGPLRRQRIFEKRSHDT